VRQQQGTLLPCCHCGEVVRCWTYGFPFLRKDPWFRQEKALNFGFSYHCILGFYIHFNPRLWHSPFTCLRSLRCPNHIIISLIYTNVQRVRMRITSPRQVISIFNHHIVTSINPETASSCSVHNVSDPLQQLSLTFKAVEGATITNKRRQLHQRKQSCPRFRLGLLQMWPTFSALALLQFLLASDFTHSSWPTRKILNCRQMVKEKQPKQRKPTFNIQRLFALLPCYLWRTKWRKVCPWAINFRLWQGYPSAPCTLLFWDDKELNPFNYKYCFPFILHFVLLKHHLSFFLLPLTASPVFSCISNHFWCICYPG